jgi:prepilin-type N-terminal cleavage/methylation domain-containing protein
MKRASGFTLIEILLVLSIISVLTAIIFAAFAPVREKSRERVCISNLHQYGRAFAMYIADYDGIEPVKGVRMSHSQLGLPYESFRAGFYETYLKSKEVRFCPSYHDPRYPLHEMGSTYAVGAFGSEEDPLTSELDYPGIVAQRGEEYSLVICDQHNPNLDFKQLPAWATIRGHILRINQQVSIRKDIPVHNRNYYTW